MKKEKMIELTQENFERFLKIAWDNGYSYGRKFEVERITKRVEEIFDKNRPTRLDVS